SDVEAWVEPIATAAGFSSDGWGCVGARRLQKLTPVMPADSATGIISLWFRDMGARTSNWPFVSFAGSASELRAYWSSASNKLFIDAADDVALATIFSISGAMTPEYDAGVWNHL